MLISKINRYVLSRQIIFSNVTDGGNIHPMSNGCLNGGFMDASDVTGIIQLTTFTNDEVHRSIPQGLKNNMFFVVQNDNNLENQQKGACSTFSDDGGV